MQLKKYTSVIVGLLWILSSGCVSTGKATKPMSDENKANLYLQMGVRYLDMNMLKIAKENLELALDFDSRNGKIYNALGVLNERLNQGELAGQYYQQALSLNAGNISIKNNYGRYLCEKNQHSQGLILLKQALEMPLNNRRWLTYTNLGRCELSHNKLPQAEANFRQALLENIQYSPALESMQKISYQNGQFLSARGFLERYLVVAKHTAETLWYAVQTERALGNEVLTETYSEQLLNLFPVSKEAEKLKKMVNR